LGKLKLAIGFGNDAALSGGFSLLVFVLAARMGSVQEFGQFSLTLMIITAQTILAHFGLGTLIYGRSVVRELGAKRLLGSAIIFTSILGIFFYLFTLLVCVILTNEYISLLYALAGLRLIGAIGSLIPQHAMGRHALSEYLPARYLTIGVATMLAGYFYWANWQLPMLAFIWGAEGLLFSSLCALTIGRKHAKLSLRNRYRPYISKGAPIALQTLFIIIYLRFDQFYVGWRFEDSALGIYAAAARIAEAGNLAFNVLTLVVSPLIIRRLTTSKRMGTDIKIFLTCLGFISLGLSITVIFTGKVFLTKLLGPAYADAYLILAIYIGSVSFVSYGSIGSRVLAAQGRSSAQIMSGAVGAVSNVFLSIILGEFMGLEGVAIATVCSYAFAAAIIWIGVFQHKKACQSFK
jgi:PST family polysaccharide transporter